MPNISPANIEDWNENKCYETDDDYSVALADAMHTEYQTIVDAGFLMQIDDPRLVTLLPDDPSKTVAGVRNWAPQRVEAAQPFRCRGIPTERIRYHHLLRHQRGPARA